MKIIPPDFILIPYQLLADDELSHIDKLIYGFIYWFHSLKKEKCTASNPSFAELLKVNIQAVSDSLGRLEKLGYIERIFKDSEKKVRLEIIPLVTFEAQGVRPNRLTVRPKDLTQDRPNDLHNNNNTNKSNKVTTTNVVAEQSSAPLQVNSYINLFRFINHSYKQLFNNKTQRAALERVAESVGEEKLQYILKVIPVTNRQPYAPVITTPVKLEEKLQDLILFLQRKKVQDQEGGVKMKTY